MNQTFERETVEFLPVIVTLEGAVVVSGVELSVTRADERPTQWRAPAMVGGEIGVMVEGLAVGDHVVWARVSSSPETPVFQCGQFSVR